MIITPVDFLAWFPAFGGMDSGSILAAIEQAESEHDPGLSNWVPITMNLIAHILTARTLGVAQSVDAMGTANGSSKFSLSQGMANQGWKGSSLESTPYGREVARLLVGTVAGPLFV
jgi:hypothetical protein